MFLLIFLVALTKTTDYSFNGTTVSATPGSNSASIHSASGNACFKLISRNLHLYHLSSQGVLQSWPKSNLSIRNLNASVLPS